MKKFLSKCTAVLLSLTVVCSMSAVSFADEPVTKGSTDSDMVYAVIDMPIADFYYGELKEIDPAAAVGEVNLTAEDPVAAAGYRDEGVYDAMTSASARLKTGQLPTITKDIVNDGEKDHLVYIGMKDVTIAVPKALYDSILAAQAEEKECSNKALTFFDKDTAVTTEPASTEYKVMQADGSFSKMVTESYVDEDAQATIAPNDRYGEYLVTLSNIDMDAAGDESKLMGMVLTAKDSEDNVSLYGMKPVTNFYRLAQANMIAFCVTDGFHEFRDKAVRQYKHTAPLEGQTITKIQYLLKDAPDFVVNTDLKVKKQLGDPYDAEAVANAASVADVTYDKTAITTDVTFTGLPDGYDKTLASLTGTSGDVTSLASFDAASGKLTITQSEQAKAAPGVYTATFTDDEYIDVSAQFTINSGAAEDFVKMETDTLVMNDDQFTLKDYMAAMTYIKVGDKECTGTTFKPGIFFNEDGEVQFDATTTTRGVTTVYFPEEESEFNITLKASGYPDVTLKATRPVLQDGFYTTTVNTDKESYGYVTDAEGNITQRGFSYPKSNYDLPVTVEIADGKIANVAYPKVPTELVVNTSSDINYLMWAMDGHNVEAGNYEYLAKAGGNYEKYHVNPPKNGVGIRDQLIGKKDTEGVDTVTAATITSRAIINSVNQSLKKAKTGAKDDPAPSLPTPDTSANVIPEDGVYMVMGETIGFSLDAERPAILYVKDGVIKADLLIEQRQSSYPYIFAGTEEDALAAGEDSWMVPIDYDYGYKYPGSLYHNVPIKSLDKPLNFVMFAGGSKNWFNRLITFKTADLQKIPYGDYKADEFTFEGGNGKVEITCPKVHVTKNGITADIQFSSSKYTKVKIGDTEYTPVSTEGGSLFTVPLNVNAQTVVAGTTVAMSTEQTIEYTCTLNFDAENLEPVAKVYQDGFYTTTVNTNKETYGYVLDAEGNVTQRGFSYPSANYDFPVTVQIKDGKIVDVAYTNEVLSIVANTSSDINYLMWAMDGHNVTDASYNYLAGPGKNYDKYNLNPKPAKNGIGLREQIIAANGTNDVDTVTAATITSRAIIDSVDQSLAKAEKGEKDDPAPVLPTPDTSADIVPADGTYTADASSVGISLDEDEPIVLTVKNGKMTAQIKIEQRQSSYPYIYAGTEKEALEAGEAGWFYPEDYDYGYKYPGSLYKDVPIKSLDKPQRFVMFAKGSGNWFNRLITIDSKSLKETKESVTEKAEAAEAAAAKIDTKSYPAAEAKAVEAAKKALEEVLAKEDATADEIKEATAALVKAVEAAEKAKAKADAEAKKAAAEKAAKAKAKKMTVKGLKVTSKSKKATVKFKKTKGATAYQIQYKLKSAKKWSNLKKSTKKVKVTSKKLKKGKKYSFRVRTITKVNGKNVYGKWTKAKTIKIK